MWSIWPFTSKLNSIRRQKKHSNAQNQHCPKIYLELSHLPSFGNVIPSISNLNQISRKEPLALGPSTLTPNLNHWNFFDPPTLWEFVAAATNWYWAPLHLLSLYNYHICICVFVCIRICCICLCICIFMYVCIWKCICIWWASLHWLDCPYQSPPSRRCPPLIFTSLLHHFATSVIHIMNNRLTQRSAGTCICAVSFQENLLKVPGTKKGNCSIVINFYYCLALVSKCWIDSNDIDVPPESPKSYKI